MSFQGGDDSLQLFDDSSRGFDDSPGPGKIWLHDIPILLRAGPMCLGDGPKFLCAGTFSVPVRGSSIQPYLKGSDLTGAIAAQAQAGGGTAVTAVKNKKRSVLDGLLRRLAQYVQANCNDDVQFVLKSGFQAKTTPVRSQTPLDKATILSVDNGHTKQLVVAAQKVPRAKLYEVQAAAVGANNTVGPFQTAGVFNKSRSMTITGLTPGTIYAIQVRALGGSTGSGDWSDAVTHMCM